MPPLKHFEILAATFRRSSPVHAMHSSESKCSHRSEHHLMLMHSGHLANLSVQFDLLQATRRVLGSVLWAILIPSAHQQMRSSRVKLLPERLKPSRLSIRSQWQSGSSQTMECSPPPP